MHLRAVASIWDEAFPTCKQLYSHLKSCNFNGKSTGPACRLYVEWWPSTVHCKVPARTQHAPGEFKHLMAVGFNSWAGLQGNPRDERATAAPGKEAQPRLTGQMR